MYNNLTLCTGSSIYLFLVRSFQVSLSDPYRNQVDPICTVTILYMRSKDRGVLIRNFFFLSTLEILIIVNILTDTLTRNNRKMLRAEVVAFCTCVVPIGFPVRIG